MFKVQNYIDGKFQDALSGKWLDNYEPATGKVYSHVADSDETDLQLAYQAAKKAFATWSKLTKETRASYLNKIADGIEKRFDEFAAAEAKDTGKPLTLAKNMDISRAIANFRFFAGAVLHHEEMSTEMDGVAINYTVRQPVGVVGLISPWNLPLYLLSWKVAPAISVGNTVVCKPSEMTSVTAWLMCQVMQEVGLPQGVVNVVCGYGHKAGQAMVVHEDIRLISFTGGTKTAESIIKSSAPFYKKLSLELGGKNPNVIFDDCNLDQCVETTIRSSFLNQGEICLCGSRIYVQETVYEEFLRKFLAKIREMKIGNPFDASTNVGALITKEHMAKVLSYIDIAKKDGKVEIGGSKPDDLPEELRDGYFVAPTVITGVSQQSACIQDEIFGPVVTVSTFKTEEEAIELANGVKYGLAACVWTENVRRANRVALSLHAGTVWVNCWLARDLRVPFGGTKHSGIGREGGNFSIDFYTEHKTVCLKYAEK
jgi:aminomuconate-semialdehyde/2-hydroxymuconate-6-semialdehyde dehydrogenase